MTTSTYETSTSCLTRRTVHLGGDLADATQALSMDGSIGVGCCGRRRSARVAVVAVEPLVVVDEALVQVAARTCDEVSDASGAERRPGTDR